MKKTVEGIYNALDECIYQYDCHFVAMRDLEMFIKGYVFKLSMDIGADSLPTVLMKELIKENFGICKIQTLFSCCVMYLDGNFPLSQISKIVSGIVEKYKDPDYPEQADYLESWMLITARRMKIMKEKENENDY